MCGIADCVDRERCVEVLMQGSSNFEYSGYDSTGFAMALPGHRGPEVDGPRNLAKSVTAE
ncbi:MAG: hypothetical protein M3R38_34610 [Actinomycetota bacterium]|nr:hypothetical protein [Actinomycetota bacterium]MDP9480740.1 hypothetical protein [Actinomycetota bacterium]